MQMQKELERIQNATKFDLSTSSRDEYESIEKENWKDLIYIIQSQACENKEGEKCLKQKDIIILRLYLTFMGLDLAQEADDSKFLSAASEFLEDCGEDIS